MHTRADMRRRPAHNMATPKFTNTRPQSYTQPPGRRLCFGGLFLVLLVTILWRSCTKTVETVDNSFESHLSLDSDGMVSLAASVEKGASALTGLSLELFLDPYHHKSQVLSDWNIAPVVLTKSLAVVIPVTLDTIETLELRLMTVLIHPSKIDQIIITSSAALLASTRHGARNALEHCRRFARATSAEVDLVPWLDGMDDESGTLYAASYANKPWILLLDTTAMQDITPDMRDLLLNPRSLHRAWGPRGVVRTSNTIKCMAGTASPQAASFLAPPILIPATLLSEIASTVDVSSATWASFGIGMMQLARDGIEGILIDLGSSRAIDQDLTWCSKLRQTEPESRGIASPRRHEGNPPVPTHLVLTLNPPRPSIGNLGLLLPTVQALLTFSSTACSLQKAGQIFYILIYEDAGTPFLDNSDTHYSTVAIGNCSLSYTAISSASPRWAAVTIIQKWLEPEQVLDVLIIPKDGGILIATVPTFLQRSTASTRTTLIEIPITDLSYTDWMGTCSLEELRSDLTIIQNFEFSC